MPNHVTTICTVTGPAADVAAFAERHVVPKKLRDGGTYPDFDFATIIPRPEILDRTESSSESELGLWCLSNDAFEPVGHRAAALRGEGAAAITNNRELRAFLEERQPDVLEKGRVCAQAIAETGYRDWHDWALANWETKWGAYDYAERERSDGRFVFKFETAWSFPERVFRKLAEMHPSLVLEVASFDEGWCFAAVGQFNGRNDFRVEEELATDELYERVYGKKPERDDEDEASCEDGGAA